MIYVNTENQGAVGIDAEGTVMEPIPATIRVRFRDGVECRFSPLEARHIGALLTRAADYVDDIQMNIRGPDER